MTTTNAERFLAAFNRIERSLRELNEVTEHHSFTRLVDLAKRKNAVIRKHEFDLRSYAELRNAIVHNQITPDFIIAEPHIETVEMIEKIDALLLHPKMVGTLFKKDAITLQPQDSLLKVLEEVRHYKYTQYPVYDGNRFKGMVTMTGITYWFARAYKTGEMPKEIPTVDDILQHEKNRTYYDFIRASRTIFEAEEMFKRAIERGHHYQALLITENGQPHEPLIGIITPFDVMVVED